MPFVERQFRGLYYAMLAAFAAFGVLVAIIGASLPRILDDFGWSYSATGAVLAAGSAGYFVAAFLTGLLVRRLGPKRVIVAASCLQALGLVLFGCRPSVGVNLALRVLTGVGLGALEVVVNYSVVRMGRDGNGRAMNLMHAAFAVGAVVGPMGIGAILSAGIAWQAAYRVMAGVALALAGVFAILPFGRVAEDGDSPEPGQPVLRLLTRPLLAMSSLILLLYVGTEIGVTMWVAEYAVKVLDLPAERAAWMVTLFWVGILAGRLAMWAWHGGTRLAEAMLVLGIVCTGGLTAAVALTVPWLVAGALLVSGLGYSAIYPLVIALVGREFPRDQGPAVGAASTGGGVGSLVFPFMMAGIAGVWGIRAGFVFFLGVNVLMVALICLVVLKTRRSPGR